MQALVVILVTSFEIGILMGSHPVLGCRMGRVAELKKLPLQGIGVQTAYSNWAAVGPVKSNQSCKRLDSSSLASFGNMT